MQQMTIGKIDSNKWINPIFLITFPALTKSESTTVQLTFISRSAIQLNSHIIKVMSWIFIANLSMQMSAHCQSWIRIIIRRIITNVCRVSPASVICPLFREAGPIFLVSQSLLLARTFEYAMHISIILLQINSVTLLVHVVFSVMGIQPSIVGITFFFDRSLWA